MKINKQSNYYPEDMVPYRVVREHLRYNYGDSEELMKEYIAAATDYLEVLSDRVFCSSTPEQHETGDATYDVSPTAKDGTVTVYLDKSDINSVQALRNVTGTYAVTSIEYRDTNGDYVALVDTDARVRNTGYPIQIDFTDLEEPADIATDFDYDVYRVVLTGGDNVKDLPRQFRQAMLLLVGHYDVHRETEFIGGLTTELKEGVKRLVSTVKVY